MTKDEKLEIIMREGFTEFQARVIYDEMGCENIEDEQELIDAAFEWDEFEELQEMLEDSNIEKFLCGPVFDRTNLKIRYDK